MRESQRVKPYGWTSQYAEPKGVSRWYDCAAEELTDYAARGCKTRILYHYVDQPVLYTHPVTPSELVKAADDAFFLIDTWIKRGSISGGPYPSEERIIENLRAALDKTKSPAPAKGK